MSTDEARAAWVLTPARTGDELAAWLRLYEAAAGPPPPGSVLLPERAA